MGAAARSCPESALLTRLADAALTAYGYHSLGDVPELAPGADLYPRARREGRQPTALTIC